MHRRALLLLTLLLTACGGSPRTAAPELPPPDPEYQLATLFELDRPFPVRQGGWTEVWIQVRGPYDTPEMQRLTSLLYDRKIPIRLVDPPAWIERYESMGIVTLDPYKAPPESGYYAIRLRVWVAPDAPLSDDPLDPSDDAAMKDHPITIEVQTPTPRRVTAYLRVLPGRDPGWRCGEPGPGLPNDPAYWNFVIVPPYPTQAGWDLSDTPIERKEGESPAGPDRPYVWAMGLEEAWLRLPQEGCEPIYVITPDTGSPDFRAYWGYDFSPEEGIQPYLIRVRGDVLGHLALDETAPPPEDPFKGVSAEALSWWVALERHMTDPEDPNKYDNPADEPAWADGAAQGQAPCWGENFPSSTPLWAYRGCHGNTVILSGGGGTWNDGYGGSGWWMNKVKWLPLANQVPDDTGGGNTWGLDESVWDFAQHGETDWGGVPLRWPKRSAIIASSTSTNAPGACEDTTNAKNRGLITTWPAGNDGDPQTEPPGNCPDALSIGIGHLYYDEAAGAWKIGRFYKSDYGPGLDFIMPMGGSTPFGLLPSVWGNSDRSSSGASQRFAGLIGLYFYSNLVYHGDPYRGKWGTPELYDMVVTCFKAAASNHGTWEEETGWGWVDPSKVVDPEFEPCHGGT